MVWSSPVFFLFISDGFLHLIPAFYAKLMKQTHWVSVVPRQGLKAPPFSLEVSFQHDILSVPYYVHLMDLILASFSNLTISQEAQYWIFH